MKRRKNETFEPRKRVELPQIREHLSRQRHGMRATHLDAVCGDVPDGLLKVDFRPYRFAHLAGPGHHMGRDLTAKRVIAFPVYASIDRKSAPTSSGSTRAAW